MPRDLVLKIHMSVDGFVGKPDGDVDWVFTHFDDEMGEWEVSLLEGAGVHAMGRTLYHDMAGYWPTSTEPFAPPMNDKPKVVFSNTLRDPEWRGTTVMPGDIGESARRLKAEDGGYVLLHGGAGTARSLSRLGLIDEYVLIVHPIALGAGLPIFDAFTDLTLVGTRAFPKGAVAMTYAPPRPAAAGP
jgi:dihydrofolate reductase